MVVAIVIMSFVIVVLLFFIVMLYSMIGTLNKQIELLDKEQHTQNNEIMMLMKYKLQHDEMLLQHIEILKYLVEQDPMLSKKKVIYGGPIGEA
jgi:hypothetical protein